MMCITVSKNFGVVFIKISPSISHNLLSTYCTIFHIFRCFLSRYLYNSFKMCCTCNLSCLQFPRSVFDSHFLFIFSMCSFFCDVHILLVLCCNNLAKCFLPEKWYFHLSLLSLFHFSNHSQINLGFMFELGALIST